MDGRRPGLFNIVPSEPVIWYRLWDGNTEAGSLIPKDAHFRGRWSVDPTLSACLSRWSGWGRSNGVRGSTPALQPTPPVLERAWPRLALYFVRGPRDPAWPGERVGRMVGACSRGECRISNCSFQSGVEETNVMRVTRSRRQCRQIPASRDAVGFVWKGGEGWVLPGVPKPPQPIWGALFDVSARLATPQ